MLLLLAYAAESPAAERVDYKYATHPGSRRRITERDPGIFAPGRKDATQWVVPKRRQ